MQGFDPLISLKTHVALLSLYEEAKNFVEDKKGLTSAIGKIVGQAIVTELDESKKKMRENKMWIDENPLFGKRYRYSLNGRKFECDVSEADLTFYQSLVQQTIETKISSLP
ncbi:hypothetical protein GZH47_32365 (plasmid) [Paenibacillus rhizovicinus]|uniref:Uncharacterized protein n=1 Tax=Paenibacillus rhizovicinus TaxID=2704463 RepID=A0A6C0PB30_9BACL|nr:hypothetical protein [Paenibacillus rhizovicinus]QHW35581.1 hypothetical protein GZH47_32365 [Paenibacillus rhizovicinus]